MHTHVYFHKHEAHMCHAERVYIYYIYTYDDTVVLNLKMAVTGRLSEDSVIT